MDKLCKYFHPTHTNLPPSNCPLNTGIESEKVTTPFLAKIDMTSTPKSSRRSRLTRYLPQLNTDPKLRDLQQTPSTPQTYLSMQLNKELNLQRETAALPFPCPYIPPNPTPDKSRMKGNRLRKRVIQSQSSAQNLSDDHGSKLCLPAASGLSENRTMTDSLVKPSQLVEGDGENVNTKTRKSWIPGARSRASRHKTPGVSEEPHAWVNAGTSKIEYDLSLLLQGEKVPELWNNTAEILVYLWLQENACAAQFRVSYAVIQSSSMLRNLIQEPRCRSLPRSDRQSSPGSQGITSSSVTEKAASSPSQKTGTPLRSPSESSSFDNLESEGSYNAVNGSHVYHLYLPVGLTSAGTQPSVNNIQRLVDVRNMFALLTSQPLIATRASPTYFQIFLAISALLREFEFNNEDGSSFGTAVDQAFSFCLKEIPQLADCRESKEATIQALILAEAMKSTELYNEAFAHAVGKYDSLASTKPGGVFDLISPSTRNRLEKSFRDLKQRIRSVNDRLSNFEFPSLFVGIAASTSMAESKLVRFKQWRLSFAAFRRQVIAHYRELHGQWPPKANSKKNNFVNCGLNRLVLKGLYSDLCDLYDFLADRESLTTRVYDGDGEEEPANVAPGQIALRKLLDEYDRSSPPVQPPIPFDVPLEPSLRSIDPAFHSMGPKEQHQKLHNKLHKNDVTLIITDSHNLDADYKTPFLEMFKAFEFKEAKGKTALELSEQRYGYWIFLYACLQALPLLVTDAPGIQYSDGVEYFLCQVPLGHFPWIEDQSQVKMTWFGVQGGQQIVSLPSDVVNYGVEATYRQSHCWEVAQEWIGSDLNSVVPDNLPGDDFSPLSPPPGFDSNGFSYLPRRAGSVDAASQCSSQISGISAGYPRSRSRQRQRNSIALGLERVRVESDDDLPGYPSRAMSPISMTRRPQSRACSRAHSYVGDGELTERREFVGSTFDEILGSIVTSKKAKEPKKGKTKK